jgi:hypothetical protein
MEGGGDEMKVDGGISRHMHVYLPFAVRREAQAEAGTVGLKATHQDIVREVVTFLPLVVDRAPRVCREGGNLIVVIHRAVAVSVWVATIRSEVARSRC